MAADVLEHLYDPWATMREIKTVLAADGHLVGLSHTPATVPSWLDWDLEILNMEKWACSTAPTSDSSDFTTWSGCSLTRASRSLRRTLWLFHPNRPNSRKAGSERPGC